MNLKIENFSIESEKKINKNFSSDFNNKIEINNFTIESKKMNKTNIKINKKKKNKEKIKLKNEKLNKLKKIFFKGLIFYSDIQKITEISKNKLIMTERFLVLTENEIKLYKSLEKFIKLENPIFVIEVKNIITVKKIDLNVKKNFFYFGIKYKIDNNNNNDNNNEDIIFFGHKNQKIIFGWIHSIINLFNNNNKNINNNNDNNNNDNIDNNNDNNNNDNNNNNYY